MVGGRSIVQDAYMAYAADIECYSHKDRLILYALWQALCHRGTKRVRDTIFCVHAPLYFHSSTISPFLHHLTTVVTLNLLG